MQLKAIWSFLEWYAVLQSCLQSYATTATIAVVTTLLVTLKIVILGTDIVLAAAADVVSCRARLFEL